MTESKRTKFKAIMDLQEQIDEVRVEFIFNEDR